MSSRVIRRAVDVADRDRFLRDLVAAFDDLGVPRGGTFVVTAPGAATGDPRDVVDGPARSGDTETAQAAARIMPGSRASKRYRVLEAIVNAGDVGATAEQFVERTGIEYRTLTPRVGELKRGGWAIDSGRTRLGERGARQSVLVATSDALEHFRRIGTTA